MLNIIKDYSVYDVIGITSGGFDILHPLHINYLNRCKQQCDYLIVLVDSDLMRRTLTGKQVVFNEEDRKYMLENISAVDEVRVIQDMEDFSFTVTVLTNIRNGADIRVFKNSNTIYGQPVLRFPGTELVIIEDITRFQSTTQIKEFIKTTQ